MALPTVRSLPDCADFATAIAPAVDQLYSLPYELVDIARASVSNALAARSLSGCVSEAVQPFAQLYVDTNPLATGFAMSVALAAVFLVVSEINRNYSQVDRCWSILPTLYIGHFNLWARLHDVSTAKLDAALLCSFVWTCRLTFNYARKGGYSVGSEDYRWKIVQNAIPMWMFHLLNLTFISFIQSVLLYAIAAPAYTLLLASTLEPELTAIDTAFTVVQLGLVVFEWFADQQQWVYQSAKSKYLKTAKVPAGFTQAALDRGFLTDGLWAYSRHPNFAAEQAIWLSLFQWSCVASSTPYHWLGVGAGVLVLLFQSSTWLTEKITAGKYPEYKEYQKQVNMFVPTTSFSGYKAPSSRARVIKRFETKKD